MQYLHHLDAALEGHLLIQLAGNGMAPAKYLVNLDLMQERRPELFRGWERLEQLEQLVLDLMTRVESLEKSSL